VALANLNQATQARFERVWKAKVGDATGEINPGGEVYILPDGAKLDDIRIWRNKKGSHFRGQFVNRAGDVIQVLDVKGKIYKVPLASLSAADRQWFDAAWKQEQGKKTRLKGLTKAGQVIVLKDDVLPKVAPMGFRRFAEDKVTRLNLPLVAQSEYHDEDFNNLSSSMVPFMLWWHNYKVVNTPANRDDNETRIKWLYKKLNRHELISRYGDCRGFENFFHKELKTSACFQILDLRNGKQVFEVHKTLDRFSPEFLSKYTQGANATILGLPVYKKGRKEWTAEVPLVECSAQGDVVFYMFGDVKLTGKLEKLPLDKKAAAKRGDKLARYEIKINNMEDTPDWFQDREYTFFLEGKEKAGLIVIVPNVAENQDKGEDK